jgi:hypothetical protein
MTTIKAWIRAGRIEVQDPIDLPDGTEISIRLPSETPLGLADSDELDTPEAIQSWIRWYGALEPLEFSEAELTAWENARREEKASELADWEQQSRRAEGLFR